MDKIKWLFEEYSQTDGYMKSEPIVQMQAVQSKEGKAISEMVDYDLYLKLDKHISASEAACEECGLIAGFRLAVELLKA